MQQRLRPRLTNDRQIIPPESSSLPLSKAQVSFYKFVAEFSQFQIYETVTAGFPANFRRSMPELDLNPRDLSIIAGFCSPGRYIHKSSFHKPKSFIPKPVGV